MSTTAVDQVEAEAFAGRMLGVLNSGMLCLMLSVGHRTGLFDTMAAMPAATSEAIARQGQLDERYVREWLNAMTVARVVDYDATTGSYRLPPEHAAFLTRAAGPNNFSSMAQFESLMGGVEDDIVNCFRKGGGVPYSKEQISLSVPQMPTSSRRNATWSGWVSRGTSCSMILTC